MKLDNNDDVVLELLRTAASEADPVPTHVIEAARSAFATRDLDGELAELIADSASTAPDLMFDTIRRSPGYAPTERLLSFFGAGVQIDMEVSRQGRAVTLTGQLTGAVQEGCGLEYSDGRREPVELDAVGRFVVVVSQTGPVRVRCQSLAGQPVVASWVSP
jgi:hypothetical protein